MSFEIRLAGVEDIPAIRAMADVVFRRTYRDILSAEQMEYMMDMMYSEESLRRQMGPEGNVFFLAEEPGCPAAGFEAGPGAEDQAGPGAVESLAPPAERRQAGLGAGQPSPAADEPLAGPAAGRHAGLGYASVRPDGFMPDGRPRWHLEKLYVMPDAQRTGLGRALFERALAAARALSCMPDNTPGSTSDNVPGGLRIELNVNRANPALGFYEHLGMRRDRQGDFPIGAGFYMNDYIMALDVK